MSPAAPGPESCEAAPCHLCAPMQPSARLEPTHRLPSPSHALADTENTTSGLGPSPTVMLRAQANSINICFQPLRQNGPIAGGDSDGCTFHGLDDLFALLGGGHGQHLAGSSGARPGVHHVEQRGTSQHLHHICHSCWGGRFHVFRHEAAPHISLIIPYVINMQRVTHTRGPCRNLMQHSAFIRML